MICKWTDDSQRFILEYFDIIHSSPSKIYHYALPFSPSRSWLHECYSSDLLQGVKVIKGLRVEWGTCRTVSYDSAPKILTYWGDLVAAGFRSGSIITFDAITGVYISAPSGHTCDVYSLTFSSDGIFLVSGSKDNTVKLLDVQTGGVIKTFHGHTGWVLSVSISLDNATVASGSVDRMIRLWDTQTGDCCCIITGHNQNVMSVSFSPTNSQLLISASYDHTVRQWDINGCQIGPTCDGDGVVFSSDGAYFVSWKWRGTIATVRNSNSGLVVTELQLSSWFQYCCFSHDGKFVAGSSDRTIYVWDITSSDPHPIQTFSGHTGNITSLTFSSSLASSSSLISSSDDQSIKFWQIGVSPTNPVTTGLESMPPSLAPITLISLQTNDGIAISSDMAGVVKTWDILTGHCKASFNTPAKGSTPRDVRLVGSGLLIFAWCTDEGIHIWDIEKGELLQIVDAAFNLQETSLRVSGDGSKVFLIDNRSIQAWSIQTGEAVGEVKLKAKLSDPPLTVDGSRVWVHFMDSPSQGWDFGIPGLVPTLLSNIFLDIPRLDFTNDVDSPKIIDRVTGKDVFHLPGEYAEFTTMQWDGQYLVAGYGFGEVVILDFTQMVPQ